MKTVRRSNRGGATVELAVLMIVLIPTIMYTMYLEDLLYFKFDLEETVVSSAWDYANADFRKNKGGDISGTVRQSAMQTFWDHTSAWNSYADPNYDAKETVHHQEMTAHQCWLAQGGQEIACDFTTSPSSPMSVGLVVEPTFIFKNQGGLASCDAILGVQNYFLPNQFFQWFGKVSISGKASAGAGGGTSDASKDSTQERKRHTAGQSEIHNEAKGDTYLYPKIKFGVVHDSWALYKTDDIDPDVDQLLQPLTGSEFSRWVKIPYGLRSQYLSDANKFADDAVDKEILTSQVKTDGIGDRLSSIPIAYKKDPQRLINGHHTSGWTDSRHSGTQGTMVDKYLGMPDTTW